MPILKAIGNKRRLFYADTLSCTLFSTAGARTLLLPRRRERSRIPENFRSGTDGLYQTVDGEAFRVMNIKIEGITAIYDYCTLCFYFYYYSTVTLLARFLGLSTSRPLATLT